LENGIGRDNRAPASEIAFSSTANIEPRLILFFASLNITFFPIPFFLMVDSSGDH
jgi:hypothetical protein